MKIKNLFLIFVLLGLLTLSYGDTAARDIDRSETSLVPSTTAGWTFEGNQESASLGYSWEPAGDVNDDGFDDIIIGINMYDTTTTNAGRVMAFYGSADGYDPVAPDWTVDGENAEDRFGYKVSGAGDVNGDGFDDVLIGSLGFDGALTNIGKAYLYYGSATGLSPTPAWTATGTLAYDYFGQCLAGVGNLNGDKYDDVAIGAYGLDAGQTDEGKVFVYYGSETGLSEDPDWTAESNQANAWFGYYINGIGDVNDDGCDDLLVSAPKYDLDTTDEGAVFAWYGAEGGLGDPGTPANADWKAESNQASVSFGSTLGTPGDVNGDGHDDVIVGTYNYDYVTSNIDDGIVLLWYGSEEGINEGDDGNPDNAAWLASSLHYGFAYGSMTGTPADINHDGYADVVIGCLLGTPGVYVYFGSEDGPNLGVNGNLTNADWQVTVLYNNEFRESIFGWLAGSPGDANGDGVDDLAVVARDYQNYIGPGTHAYREGKIWAYYTDAGTISGTATYDGTQTETGPISVSAHLNPNDSPVSLSDNIESGETYSVGGLDGSYYLIAVMDLNDNGGPPDPGEPIGWYDGDSDGHPDLVDVAAGEHITGKDITLTDPGSISGTVTYIGSLGLSGPIRVTAHLSLVEPPIANADAISSGETYSITGLPAGSYYISAYMDVNDSGGAPDPGEPSALYDSNGDGVPDKVVVSGGDDVTGIDLEFDDIRIFLPLILR